MAKVLKEIILQNSKTNMPDEDYGKLRHKIIMKIYDDYVIPEIQQLNPDDALNIMMDISVGLLANSIASILKTYPSRTMIQLQAMTMSEVERRCTTALKEFEAKNAK